MDLPELPYGGAAARRQLVAFGGINYGEDAAEGELAESTGLSARAFPCLTQRGGRESVRPCNAPNGIFAWGKLCVVDGTSLIYDGEPVGTVTDGAKEWAVVNTKLCIFPDKMYLDLENLEFLPLEGTTASKEGTDSVFTTDSVTLDTEELAGRVTPKYVHWFLNMSSSGNLLTEDGRVKFKRYTSADWEDGTWMLEGESEVESSGLAVGNILMLRRNEIAGSYVLNTKSYTDRNQKGTHTITVHEDYSENDDRGCYALITALKTVSRAAELGYAVYDETTVSCEIHDATKAESRLTVRFAVGDRVDVSGCTGTLEGNNVEKAVVKAVDDYKLTFAADTFTAGKESGQITIKRPVPDLAFICESDNRLWGCEGHTVWASALGDPKNFYVYDGLSTDSYAVAVGSDGEFTGCIAYSGDVLIWKEQCLHKVLGNYPAEYTLYTYDISGLQAGSHKSLDIINEVLYYKGRDGVYAYTGSTPTLISAALGNRRYGKAVAGDDGQRYYISMLELNNETWGLFAYDTVNRMWLREDNTQAIEFANLDGTLYLLDKSAVWATGRNGGDGDAIKWSAELAPFRDGTLERKRNLRLSLRLELEDGATVAVETREDRGPWKRVWQTGNGRNRTVTIPLRPRRCDEFSIRISGTGKCLIRALVREIQVGSGV